MPSPSTHQPDLHATYDGATVTVTGGAGFIGSHLTHRLVNLGARVHVIDDLSEGDLANLADIDDQIEFIEASILDVDGIRSTINESRYVFHEAAMASVPRSVAEPELAHDVNVTGTLRLLEAARDARHMRGVVFASSSSVYGDLPELPKHELQLPAPMSPYAQQKLAAESLMQTWTRCYGLRTISLRYFNVFGPNQRADSAYAAVVAAFADALLRQQAPVIFGDGSATRDFTFIDNVVEANLRAGARLDTIADAPAINIAGGLRITILDLARRMASAAGSDIEPMLAPPRAGDVPHSLADISRARQRLGFQVMVDLDTGLRQTIDWYRSVLTLESS